MTCNILELINTLREEGLGVSEGRITACLTDGTQTLRIDFVDGRQCSVVLANHWDGTPYSSVSEILTQVRQASVPVFTPCALNPEVSSPPPTSTERVVDCLLSVAWELCAERNVRPGSVERRSLALKIAGELRDKSQDMYEIWKQAERSPEKYFDRDRFARDALAFLKNEALPSLYPCLTDEKRGMLLCEAATLEVPSDYLVCGHNLDTSSPMYVIRKRHDRRGREINIPEHVDRHSYYEMYNALKELIPS